MVRLRCFDPGNKPVTFANHCLQNAWPLRVVPESSTKFVDSGIDSMPGIHKNVITPQPPSDFLARYQFARFLDKQDQKLHGSLFELHYMITTAHLVAPQVQLKVRESGTRFSEARSCSMRYPGKPARKKSARRPNTFKIVALAFVCSYFFTACGGGGSSSGVVSNPTPTIAFSPNSAKRGGPSFTLTVNGGNFVSGAVVQWNGTPRPTTFANGTQLSAQISAADIVAAGTEKVTAFNPAPGGGTSNGLTFNIPCVLAPAGPASGQRRARLGAYYFDGWAGPPTSYHLVQLVNSAYQDRQPLSGWRDDNNCAVEQQLAWANSFGIDFFVFDWYFNATSIDSGEDLNSALKITHTLLNRHGMQFAILYVDQPPFTITNTTDWTTAVNEWVSYMTDPAYVLVNGKPLFIVIDLYAMREAFGSSSAVNTAFGRLRTAIQAHGFPGVYIVGGLDFIGGSSVPAGTRSVDGIFPDLSMAVADGYDAISMYDYGSGLQNLGTIVGLQPFSTISDTGQ